MKKITLLAFALFSTIALQAQTITLAPITTIEFTDMDETNNPNGSNPDIPYTITLEGYTPGTSVTVYSQLRDASNMDNSSNQVAGKTFALTIDASGNASAIIDFAWWPSGVIDPTSGNVNWNVQAAPGSNASLTVPYTVETLGSKINKNELNLSYYNTRQNAIIIGNKISGEYFIYDITGKIVQQGTVTNSIDVQSLASGIYILSTESGMLKIIK